MTVGLTQYITPAMLLATSYGVSWGTFPRANASVADQVAAQLDVCSSVTSDMDSIANQTLRATVDVEREFGPDLVITIEQNGWARFRMSHWPISQLLGARVSPSGSAPPTWSAIPTSALILEHTGLPTTGTIVPAGSGPGPTSVLIAPGYVDWFNGRKGYLVEMTTISGFPTAGIDQAAVAGATSIHVDDVTGWWDPVQLAGARGTIADPPLREDVLVSGMTPDVAGAISGSGTLTLSAGLRFGHTPRVGVAGEADQRILVTAMPYGLLQGAHYLATHYGLIRGSTASVMQTARGQAAPSSMKTAMDWYEQGRRSVERYARVW